MLIALDDLAHRIAVKWPITNVYGLARTLVALSTLVTMLFSQQESLFRPVAGIPDYPNCMSLSGFSAFCVFPGEASITIGWYVSIAILIVAASGWRPRYVAIPHWWVAASFHLSSSIPDGGDQVAANLALLMIPIAILDSRTWHWQSAPSHATGNYMLRASLIAWAALLIIKVQVAGIYLQSSVAKLAVGEWVDGTALYYWMTDAYFGLPSWSRPIIEPVLANPIGVQALTWGPVALEFGLFLGLFARRSLRPYFLIFGIAFHTGIAIFMGLPSFALAMFAALVLRLFVPERGAPL